MSDGRTNDWRGSIVGLGIVIGVGGIIGLILAGGTGLALGGVFGAASGVALGAMARSLYERRD